MVISEGQAAGQADAKCQGKGDGQGLVVHGMSPLHGLKGVIAGTHPNLNQGPCQAE
jgi:hypothetical protein